MKIFMHFIVKAQDFKKSQKDKISTLKTLLCSLIVQPTACVNPDKIILQSSDLLQLFGFTLHSSKEFSGNVCVLSSVSYGASTLNLPQFDMANIHTES